MEKVQITPEQAKEVYKTLATDLESGLSPICAKLSSDIQQVIEATEGKLLPNKMHVALAALSDSIQFLHEVVNGGEELLAPPKKPEVPEECKALFDMVSNTVTIKVPSFDDEKILGEWIMSDLITSLSNLWGESKNNVQIFGKANAEENKTEFIVFKLKSMEEEIEVQGGDSLTFKTIDNADWIKVTRPTP